MTAGYVGDNGSQKLVAFANHLAGALHADIRANRHDARILTPTDRGAVHGAESLPVQDDRIAAVRRVLWIWPAGEPLRLMTMATYSGPARLILADGARVTGMASLSTNQRGGNGWGGTFRPDQVSTDLRNAREGLQLELPYDQIGAVAVTSIRKLLATQVLMSLDGRGPAPF